MTIEEAIKILQDGEWWDDYSFYRPETSTSDKAKDDLLNAIDIAIYALRSKQEEENRPLSKEELWQMESLIL